MVLRSPAQFYIKYLLCHPNGYTVDAIIARMMDEGLDYIDAPYIESVRGKMPPLPKPFYPRDPDHSLSRRYIRDQQIEGMFLPDTNVRAAYELVSHAQARRQIEAMVIGNQVFQRIASAVTLVHGAYCTPLVLAYYAHYFWNPRLFDVYTLMMLMKLRLRDLSASTPDFPGKEKLLSSMFYQDPRRMAAMLPNGRVSQTSVQIGLGIMPPLHHVLEGLEELGALGIHRAAEVTLMNGARAQEEYMMWLSGAEKCYHIAQMIAKPNDSLKGLESVPMLRTSDKKIPAIHELTQGHHTVDGLPPPETSNGEAGPDFDAESGDPDSPERAAGDAAGTALAVHQGGGPDDIRG